MKARIYLPTAIPSDVRRTVLKHAANEHGGYTVLEGRGGWMSPNGDMIQEDVEILEIAGMNRAQAKSTANWVAKKTDETEVMWEIQNAEVGFESGD